MSSNATQSIKIDKSATKKNAKPLKQKPSNSLPESQKPANVALQQTRTKSHKQTVNIPSNNDYFVDEDGKIVSIRDTTLHHKDEQKGQGPMDGANQLAQIFQRAETISSETPYGRRKGGTSSLGERILIRLSPEVKDWLADRGHVSVEAHALLKALMEADRSPQ